MFMSSEEYIFSSFRLLGYYAGSIASITNLQKGHNIADIVDDTADSIF